jgi:hypothetical protein
MENKEAIKIIDDPVLNLGFRVDTPALLAEIANAGLAKSMGILYLPMNIFREWLVKLSARAIEINDPELNIIMLSMGLYEAKASEIPDLIRQQHALIKTDKTKQP